MSENKSYDVVIIGAGVAGGIIAAKLSQCNYRVLILEAGEGIEVLTNDKKIRSKLSENYVLTDWKDKTPGSPYPNPACARSPRISDLTPENLDDPEKGYYVQKNPDSPFGSTYERRVGGTTWHWLGTCLRFLPNDFKMKTTYGVGRDWPLSYSDLKHYYLEAEQELGVAGDNDTLLGALGERDYPQPMIPLSYLNKKMIGAVSGLVFQKLAIKVESTPQARNTQMYQNRPPCCGNGTCIPICPIQAKYDATVHLKIAVGNGAKLIEKAVAHKIEADDSGKITGVRYLTWEGDAENCFNNFGKPTGNEEVAVGKIYIIAAHAIETAKLLLMSTSEKYPNGIANSSNQVGKNLMDHNCLLSYALTKEPVYPFRGPLSTAGVESLRDGKFRREHAAFRIEIGNDGWLWPTSAPFSEVIHDLPSDQMDSKNKGKLQSFTNFFENNSFGIELRNEITDHLSRQIRLTSLLEMLPSNENYIVPSTEYTDGLGIPRPEIHYHYDDYLTKGRQKARQVHQDIFDAMGATKIHHEDKKFYGAGHVVGTYRMGDNPADSVVDSDQKSHDHENLYLVGSGTFPTVTTANPTLTIAALSLKTTDAIMNALKNLCEK